MNDLVNSKMREVNKNQEFRNSSPPKVQPYYPQQEELKYIRNQVDQFENHLADIDIQIKRSKLEKINQSQQSRSRSKSVNKFSSTQDFKTLETRLQKKWTNQLTNVVDKLGKLIKK